MNPTICMDPHVRLKGQATIFDHLQVLGPLSNRRITTYIRQGFYGASAMRRQALVDSIKKPVSKARRSNDILKDLLSK